MHGLTVDPGTLRKKANQIGDVCDEHIHKWRNVCEIAKQEDTCLSLLKDELTSCDYLPNLMNFCHINISTSDRSLKQNLRPN
jgi:hypothetical protein